MQNFSFNVYKRLLKRVFDLLITIFILIITFPIFIIILLFLTIANKGHPFFHQYRPGNNNRIFKIVKFKTLNDKKDKQGNLLPDVLRITVAGRFIRKTSLDELPQLFSVLKGDMSLVGPRPLLIEYLPLYNNEQARRHEVRPGITGWAQVNGRNAISWEEKFRLDVYYVDHISFLFDMKILILTVWKIIKQEGINSNHTETMKKFTGSKII